MRFYVSILQAPQAFVSCRLLLCFYQVIAHRFPAFHLRIMHIWWNGRSCETNSTWKALSLPSTRTCSYFALLWGPLSVRWYTFFTRPLPNMHSNAIQKLFTKRKKRVEKNFFKKTISYSIAYLPSKQSIVHYGYSLSTRTRVATEVKLLRNLQINTD